MPLRERLRPLQQRVLSRPETGLEADKAFYDAISERGDYRDLPQAPCEQAASDVRAFLRIAGIRVVPIGDQEAATALEAFSRYGKGRGHPAQLNLAYAMAKNHRFKGDIAQAGPP